MRIQPKLSYLGALATVTGLVLFTGCTGDSPTSLDDTLVESHKPGHDPGGGGGGGSNEFSVTIELRNAAGDRLTSQGSATYVDGADGNLRIRDDGLFLWNVAEGRGFNLDFTDVIHGGDGLPADATVTRVGALRPLASEDASDELPGGLLGMADGDSLPAKLKTRAEFDAEGTYQLRFQTGAKGDNSIADSIATGSSFLTIIRNSDSGPCSTVTKECWTIEAPVTGDGPGTQDDWSMVFHKTGRGNNVTFTDEGSYHMPFRWTVICADCPPASSSDSPPTVAVTSPSDGATVSSTIQVTADASDDGSVTQVEFFVDGASLGVDSDGSDGWSSSWNTTGVADGGHTVSATATDDGGQTASDQVSVTVDNVDDLPAVAITNPADGSTVSGVVDVTADASDDGSVTQVEFFADGVSLGVDTDGSDGWSASWDTSVEADGSSHTVAATATDDGGQTASDEVTVTVDNSAPSTMHAGDLDSNSINNGRNWTAEVTITVHDGSHAAVANADVSGDWSGLGGGSADSSVCTTDATGRCTVQASGMRKNNGTVAFAVAGISHGSLAYESGDNHDPDGDSDGTSITVNKP